MMIRRHFFLSIILFWGCLFCANVVLAQRGEILVNPNDRNYTRIGNGVLLIDDFKQQIGSVQYPDSLPSVGGYKPIMVINSPFTKLDQYLNTFDNDIDGYKWAIKYPVVMDGVLMTEKQKNDLDFQKYSDIKYFNSTESAKMFQFCGCPFGVYRLR